MKRFSIVDEIELNRKLQRDLEELGRDIAAWGQRLDKADSDIRRARTNSMAALVLIAVGFIILAIL
jgi:hypothetical protein